MSLNLFKSFLRFGNNTGSVERDKDCVFLFFFGDGDCFYVWGANNMGKWGWKRCWCGIVSFDLTYSIAIRSSIYVMCFYVYFDAIFQDLIILYFLMYCHYRISLFKTNEFSLSDPPWRACWVDPRTSISSRAAPLCHQCDWQRAIWKPGFEVMWWPLKHTHKSRAASGWDTR